MYEVVPHGVAVLKQPQHVGHDEAEQAHQRVISAPAMADDLSCRDAWGNLVWCEGDVYAPVNDGWWDDSWWWGSDWDGDGIVQDVDQEAESGEFTQSFNVS